MSVTAIAVKSLSEPVEGFLARYTQSLRLIERLHRLMLDVIKVELDGLDAQNLNSVQTLMLNNIGKGELTIGELRSRGYYLGSNVSYNIRKLVDLGYIDYQRSKSDRRSVHIRLTEKGRRASEILDALYQRQLGSLDVVGNLSSGDLEQVNSTLMRLESFWVNQIRFRL
jgi:DNA-binding MarR family transcriptional regulator